MVQAKTWRLGDNHRKQRAALLLPQFLLFILVLAGEGTPRCDDEQYSEPQLKRRYFCMQLGCCRENPLLSGSRRSLVVVAMFSLSFSQAQRAQKEITLSDLKVTTYRPSRSHRR